MIFETERGFCILNESSLVRAIPCEHTAVYNENLISLMPWLAEVVTKTIDTCTQIVWAFATVIQMSADVAPGYRVFVRNPSSAALVELLAIRNGGSPWWDDVDSSQPEAESAATIQLL